MTPVDRASAGSACPACEAVLPGEARFCPACGARVAAGGSERGVVTVLFADLVDSTRLVESLDPEDSRGRLDELATGAGRVDEAAELAGDLRRRASAIGAHALENDPLDAGR